MFDLLEPSNRGLHLRENMKKGVFVEGLVETAVTSAAEAYQVCTHFILIVISSAKFLFDFNIAIHKLIKFNWLHTLLTRSSNLN